MPSAAKISPRLRNSLLLALAQLAPLPLLGAITAWNTTTGLWETPGNWTAGVPVAGVDFGVGNGGTIQIGTGVAGFANLGILNQSSGLEIRGTGSLTLTDEFQIGNTSAGSFTMSGGTLSDTIGNIARGAGSTGTASVSGGTWTNSQLLVVGNQGAGILTMSGSAVISSPIVELGRQSGGGGTLHLDGGVLSAGNLIESSGSGTVNFNGGTLRLTGDQSALFAGFEAGDITVQSGGAAIDTNGYNAATAYALGGAGGFTKLGAGTLILTGANTYSGGTTLRQGTLALAGGSLSHPGADLVVGRDSGDNAALLISGGTVSSASGYIGKQAGSTGSVTLNGGAWNNSVGLTVGAGGAGTLTIANGTVSAPSVTVASGANSSGSIVVQAGGVLLTGQVSKGTTSGGAIAKFELNDGTLRLTGDQSNLFAGFGTVDKPPLLALTHTSTIDTQEYAVTIPAGVLLGGSGTLVKKGSGTLTLLRATYRGGTQLREGTLALVNGSQFYATQFYEFRIAPEAGDNGTLLMTGGKLNIGTSDIQIAGAASAVGAMKLSGTASASMEGLIIGASGTGSLDLDGSATLSAEYSIIGAGSTGSSATVKGGTWTNASFLMVGSSGQGSLSINGGTVSGGAVTVGNSANAVGTITVSEGVLNATILRIGGGGRGYLTLEDGGRIVVAGSSALGSGGSGSGNGIGVATMTGGTWTNTGELRVGSLYTGTLNLSGGSVSNTIGNVGVSDGSSGTANVSGGTWTNSELLVVGNEGSGSLTISGTGQVSAPETEVGRGATGIGTLTLAGGVLSTGSLKEIAGAGTVLLDGGTLRLIADQTALFGGFETGDVTIGAAGATIDTQTFTVASVADLGGAGGLAKLGTGTLVLAGANTYAGPTTVSAGGLRVDGSLAGSSLSLADGTTLGGGGSIASPVTLGAGVTLAPGNGLGTLTTGNLTLNSSTTLNFELSNPDVVGGGVNDLVSVNGDLVLDGTLNIANLLGFGEGAYRLFDYTGSLTDNGLLFGVIPGGFDLVVSTASNQVNLTVTAVAVQYWDGVFNSPQGVAAGSGGAGVWSGATSNWTNAEGNANSTWQGGFGAVFGGPSGGVVTLADGFNATAPSLSFRTDGYTLAAAGTGALTLTGRGLVDVQTGTAIISAPLGGSAPLVKQGPGTLNLTGANTYAGGTGVRSGALAVSGSGSISHATKDLSVGRYSGDIASLSISGDASVSAATSVLGEDAGSTGSATISGGTWSNSGELRVGDSGSGTLTITGGAITSTYGNIARSYGSTGAVAMSGGSWTNSVEFLVGNAGHGTLNFTDGTISSVHSIIGAGPGITGTATMDGGSWLNSGEMRVGDRGTGVFTFHDGTITSTYGNIGRSAGSNGTVTMNGGSWTNSVEFLVGNAGTGAFTLTGGTLSSVLSTLGAGNGASGTATMSGGAWTSSSELRVGDFGNGTLTLSGGAISNTLGNIGRSSGSTGVVTVSGGIWTNTTGLNVGNAGNGTLTVTDAGVVTVNSGAGTVLVAAAPGTTGVLNIGAGGSAGSLLAAEVTGGAGAATVNFNHNGSLAFAPKLTGSLSVNQLGAGTTTLSIANTYTGGTQILGGTLRISDVGADQSVLGTGPAAVGEAGTLIGNGTVLGDTTVAGTLAPGNSAGLMTFAGNLTLDDTATLRFELGGTHRGTGFDAIDVAGDLAYDGSLTLSLIDGFTLTEGDTFQLFSVGGSITGSFSSILFTNANWTGLLDYGSGRLTVTAIPEPSNFALLAAAGGLASTALRRRRRS